MGTNYTKEIPTDLTPVESAFFENYDLHLAYTPAYDAANQTCDPYLHNVKVMEKHFLNCTTETLPIFTAKECSSKGISDGSEEKCGKKVKLPGASREKCIEECNLLTRKGLKCEEVYFEADPAKPEDTTEICWVCVGNKKREGTKDKKRKDTSQPKKKPATGRIRLQKPKPKNVKHCADPLSTKKGHKFSVVHKSCGTDEYKKKIRDRAFDVVLDTCYPADIFIKNDRAIQKKNDKHYFAFFCDGEDLVFTKSTSKDCKTGTSAQLLGRENFTCSSDFQVLSNPCFANEAGKLSDGLAKTALLEKAQAQEAQAVAAKNDLKQEKSKCKRGQLEELKKELAPDLTDDENLFESAWNSFFGEPKEQSEKLSAEDQENLNAAATEFYDSNLKKNCYKCLPSQESIEEEPLHLWEPFDECIVEILGDCECSSANKTLRFPSLVALTALALGALLR